MSGEFSKEKIMKFEMLNDFVTSAKVDENYIGKYIGKIPAELMDIWREYGFGSFFGGYLKVIAPDDYMDLVKESYFRADVSIPILGTAFGDIITWEEDQYTGESSDIGTMTLIF